MMMMIERVVLLCWPPKMNLEHKALAVVAAVWITFQSI